jgi:hypothetical protein
LKILDSGFRRNDGKTKIQTFSEIIKFKKVKKIFMNNRDISGKDIPIIQILPTAPQGST